MTDEQLPDPLADDTITPFGEFLHQQRKGQMHSDLSDGLHKLTEAVQDVGKGGTLTLTVEVKPATVGTSQIVMVTDKVQLRLPEHPREGAVWFVDKRHNLRRSNPDQPDLPLHELRRQRQEEQGDE